MSPPLLSIDGNYETWTLQLKAFWVSKNVKDDADKLALLPLCIEEPILASVSDKFNVGTTTLNSALVAIKDAWLVLGRPVDPLKEFQKTTFQSPVEAEAVRVKLSKLATYAHLGDQAVVQQLITGSPSILQPTISAHFIANEKISSSDLAKFIVRLPLPTNDTGYCNVVAPQAKLRCNFCGLEGHIERTCFKRQKPRCGYCGLSGHTEKFCFKRRKRNSENM